MINWNKSHQQLNITPLSSFYDYDTIKLPHISFWTCALDWCWNICPLMYIPLCSFYAICILVLTWSGKEICLSTEVGLFIAVMWNNFAYFFLFACKVYKFHSFKYFPRYFARLETIYGSFVASNQNSKLLVFKWYLLTL